MADILASSLKTHLLSLNASNDICDELGTVFSFGSNLFIGIEPETTNCVTIIPYGGGSPTLEGDRHDSGIQLRAKMDSVQKALKVSQGLINHLHNNDSACTGVFKAVQSSPVILGVTEGGENVITVSNYTIKHVKV